VTAGSAQSVDRWRASTTPGICTSAPIATVRSDAPGAIRPTSSAPACNRAGRGGLGRRTGQHDTFRDRGGSARGRWCHGVGVPSCSRAVRGRALGPASWSGRAGQPSRTSCPRSSTRRSTSPHARSSFGSRARQTRHCRSPTCSTLWRDGPGPRRGLRDRATRYPRGRNPCARPARLLPVAGRRRGDARSWPSLRSPPSPPARSGSDGPLEDIALLPRQALLLCHAGSSPCVASRRMIQI